MTLLRCALAALVLSSASITATASAQDTAADDDATARDLFELGQRLYSRGEFEESATAFQRAYDLSARPALLYNVYLASRDAGDAEGAAFALRRYLREENEGNLSETRDVLEARAASLEAQVARQAQQGEAGQASQAPEVQERPPAERQSIVGPVVLISAGGASILAGAIMGVLALGKESDLEDACGSERVCPPGSQDDITQGRRFARASDALLFGGVAVAAGGALWWILGRPDNDDTSAAVMCTDSGCSASVGGQF